MALLLDSIDIDGTGKISLSVHVNYSLNIAIYGLQWNAQRRATMLRVV